MYLQEVSWPALNTIKVVSYRARLLCCQHLAQIRRNFNCISSDVWVNAHRLTKQQKSVTYSCTLHICYICFPRTAAVFCLSHPLITRNFRLLCSREDLLKDAADEQLNKDRSSYERARWGAAVTHLRDEERKKAAKGVRPKKAKQTFLMLIPGEKREQWNW